MPPTALPATHFLTLTPTTRQHLHRVAPSTLLDLISESLATSNPLPLPTNDEDALTVDEARGRITTLREDAKLKKTDVIAFIEEEVWGEQVPIRIITQCLLRSAVEKDRVHWVVGVGVRLRGDGAAGARREETIQTHKISLQEAVAEVEDACKGVVGRWFIDHFRYPGTLEGDGTTPPLILFVVVGYPSPTQATLKELPTPAFIKYFALADTAPLVFISTAVGTNITAVSRDDRAGRTAAEAFSKAIRLAHVRILERNTGKDGLDIRSTNLMGKSLKVLWGLRGEVGHASRGAWSIYSSKQGPSVEKGPLGDGKDVDGDITMDDDVSSPTALHTAAVEGRFGKEGLGEKGLDRVVFGLQEEWTSGWTPNVTISMEGSHIWRGARKWVEDGIVDVEGCPAWFTGEFGVSNGVVKGGVVRGRAQI